MEEGCRKATLTVWKTERHLGNQTDRWTDSESEHMPKAILRKTSEIMGSVERIWVLLSAEILN